MLGGFGSGFGSGMTSGMGMSPMMGGMGMNPMMGGMGMNPMMGGAGSALMGGFGGGMAGGMPYLAGSTALKGASDQFAMAEQARMFAEGVKATIMNNNNTIINSNFGIAKGINF